MVNDALTVPGVPTDLIDTLNAWEPLWQSQGSLRDEYVSYVGDSAGSALDREGGAEHVTASCFVFTPNLEQVLLCFHKKGQFWVQLGGHVEATDISVASAALREAREEGGIADISPVGAILDVDRHPLGDGFTQCTVHWDIGFGAIARTDLAPSTSAESEEVAWWHVTELPENAHANFGHRVRRILAEIRHQSELA